MNYLTKITFGFKTFDSEVELIQSPPTVPIWVAYTVVVIFTALLFFAPLPFKIIALMFLVVFL